MHGCYVIMPVLRTTTNLRPPGLCPGLPGWAGARKVKPGRSKQSAFTGTRDSKWQWHQLGHMQICTSPQTDNSTSIPPVYNVDAFMINEQFRTWQPLAIVLGFFCIHDDITFKVIRGHGQGKEIPQSPIGTIFVCMDTIACHNPKCCSEFFIKTFYYYCNNFWVCLSCSLFLFRLFHKD